MKIVYPSLVEQAFKMIRDNGEDVSHPNDLKARLYKDMVAGGLLNPDGTPTRKSIDEGLVAGFSQDDQGEYEPDTVAGLKLMYPMYEGFNDNHFTKTEQGWAADSYVIRGVANQVLSDPDSTESQRQTAYAMLQQLEKFPK